MHTQRRSELDGPHRSVCLPPSLPVRLSTSLRTSLSPPPLIHRTATPFWHPSLPCGPLGPWILGLKLGRERRHFGCYYTPPFLRLRDPPSLTPLLPLTLTHFLLIHAPTIAIAPFFFTIQSWNAGSQCTVTNCISAVVLFSDVFHTLCPLRGGGRQEKPRLGPGTGSGLARLEVARSRGRFALALLARPNGVTSLSLSMCLYLSALGGCLHESRDGVCLHGSGLLKLSSLGLSPAGL